MNELLELYQTIPLPYEYVVFPKADEPRAPKVDGLYYYVNRVITGLTRRAFQHGGFTQSSTFSKWNASWGRQYEADKYVECKNWQKVNHFAGAFLMGRKDDFHQRMTELKQRDEEIATFYPESFLIPKETENFNENFPKHNTWIFKPSASARGNGICIMKAHNKPPTKRGIYQVYIEHPLLITQRKFDLRLYALVTSINPLRIYMHENGMARFATHEYNDEAPLTDLRMHLTNFSMNKDDDNFIMTSGSESIQNSKWSIQFFFQYLQKQGIDIEIIMNQIKKVTVAALIAGMSAIRDHHFKYIKHRHTSYELYGIDVILDQDLKPYIMEINISPSMEATGSKLDRDIKFPLLLDTFNMARIIKCNSQSKNPCPLISNIDDEFENSMTDQRIDDVVNNNVDPWKCPVFADFVFVRDFLEENKYSTKFNRIYPKRKTMDVFAKCFSKKLYSDIVFESWIKMTSEQRLKVISSSWEIYQDKMQKITETEITKSTLTNASVELSK